MAEYILKDGVVRFLPLVGENLPEERILREEIAAQEAAIKARRSRAEARERALAAAAQPRP